jgi:response regulator RpfG family c-di-GMP phosphodiesterase
LIITVVDNYDLSFKRLEPISFIGRAPATTYFVKKEPHQMNILLVDDDDSTLALLEKSIKKWGYDAATAGNGRQAMDHIDSKHVDIIVSDWLMPEMNGLELCERVRSLNLKRYVYIILISAQDTRRDVVRGLKCGVDDYITKPVNLEELRARIEIGVRVINLEHELNRRFLAIKRNYYQSIHMFTQLLETYNEQLGGHCRRVGKLSLKLAKRHPDVSPDDYPVIEAAGLLHDIGLIGLPETLVTKSITEMTGDEKTLYRSHPERGELILSEVDLLVPVSRLVRMHHEQMNGRGFPDGLADEQVPVGARLVGAASIYDNLIHRGKTPYDEIPERLQQYRGYQIDPVLVDLLLEINLSQMQAQADKTDEQIDIDRLKAGMVLSRDVRMKTGAFVMAANTMIDASSIQKLKRYHELGNIIDKVYITK